MSDITNELDFKSALEQFKQNSKPAPSTETEESTRSIFDFPPQSIPEGMVIENPISSEQDISADELGIVSQDGNIISIQSEPVIAPDNISEEQQLPTTITPRVEVDFFGIPIQKDEQFTGGIETNINQDTIAGVQDMPAPIVYEIPEPIPRMQFSEKSMSDSDTEQNNIIESPVEIIPIPEFQITEPNNSQQITSVQSEVVATGENVAPSPRTESIMTFEISQNQVTENTEHTEMVIQDFVPLVEIKTEAEPAVIETQKEIDMGTSIIPMDFPEIKKEEVVDFTVITSTAPAMEDSKPAIIDFNTPSGDLSSSKPEVVIDFNVQNTLPEIQENNEITPLTDSDIPNKEISIPVIQEEQVKQPQPRIIIEEPSYMRYIKFAVLPVILASFAAGYYFAGQSNTNLPPSDIKLPDPVVRIEKTSEWLLGPDTKITVEDNGTNIEQPYSKWAEILQNIKSTNPSYKFMVKSIDGIPMSKEVSIQDMERAIVPQNGSK